MAKARLMHREAEVLRLRYGVTESGHSYNLAEIARMFKVSRQRAHQIHNKAIRKLIKAHFAKRDKVSEKLDELAELLRQS